MNKQITRIQKKQSKASITNIHHIYTFETCTFIEYDNYIYV